MRRSSRCAVLAAVVTTICHAGSARAADVLWDNGSSDFIWNTTSLNWTGAPWNNANADGAVFGVAGVGSIDVPSSIVVDSIDFAADGYSLSGVGPITFMQGVSTQTTGVVNVATGATAVINTPVNSAVGFQKIGGGVLEISGPGNYTGGIPLTINGVLRADVLIGAVTGTINGGTMRVMSAAALPASTRVSIGTGYLDIGNTNVTIAQLNFTNQNPNAAWNTTLNANNGVIGSGTLRVTGDINVIGVSGLNGGNSIAANVDLGGGEQVVRCGLISSIGLQTALMFTGNISNGSLVKTLGFTQVGTFGSVDGIGLYGNNSYTGETVLNSGSSIAAGVNQSGSIKVHGLPAGPAGSSFALVGANGSFPAATSIQASAGASFILDNNTTLGPTGLIQPTVAAAQNNDRINDNAAIVLRDGNFVYRGFAGAAASETFGSLNAAAGHNAITITPNGGGSVNLNATGNLTLGSRATMLINATGAGNALGGTAQLKFAGTVPTADATGILPRIATSADFLTYDATTGLTPFTAYSPDFTTAGANVSLAASTSAPTQTINALKRSAALTLTIGATDTLSVTSGMLLQATGTGTITGGTLAFGSTPGMLVGTNNISSAITGTDGIIAATGTGTLSGDLSGLSGEISVHAATMNLNTNTFTGPIAVRSGQITFNTSQIGAGLGAVTLGVPENDVDLMGTVPTLALGSAGANAVFDRDLIVDNGAATAKGVDLSFSTVSRISPLSNNTGSQTWNGDVELRSPVNLQGGGGGGSGATVFTGAVTGPAKFLIPNGRVIFSPTSSISNDGGFQIGSAGFTAQVTFSGTASGNGPITANGGNNGQIRYTDGGLPGGPISLFGSGSASSLSLIPLNNSTINNEITFRAGFTGAQVDTGISATWAGPVNGTGNITKNGDGELNITNPAGDFSGPVIVNAGTLSVPRRTSNTATTINTGATLRISPGGAVGDPSATSVFPENFLSISGGSSPTARFDLNKNGAVFEYDTSSPAATIRAQLISGYAGNTWTGNGVVSADAAAAPNTHAVGYAEAADIGSPATFLGQPVDGTTLLVRYTRQGDANLSGTTDLDDFALLGANFNNAGVWSSGDFNYDNLTDIGDFALLASNFNQAAAGVLPRGGSVPEPAGVLLVGAMALVARRTRRS